MTKETAVKLFNEKHIPTEWDDDQEKWYFSIVNVVADTEQLFRLIQSIPSPKAEPFKLWLARVGRERIDEIEDPEIGIDRLMETYFSQGLYQGMD